MQNAKRLILSLGTALAITACGGGGGGSDAPTTPGGSPINTTPITISSSNQAAVAQAAVAEASNVGTGASDAGTILVGGVVTDNSLTSRNYSLAQSAFGAIRKALEHTPSASAIGAVQTQSANCTNGGTVTETINDANNNLIFDLGESWTLTYSNCVEGSVTQNGGYTLVISALTGSINAGTADITATLNFSNYTYAINGESTVKTHGGLGITLEQTTTNTFDAWMTLTALRTTITAGATTYLDSQQTGTVSIASANVANYSGAVMFNFTVAGTWYGGLGGQITVRNESGVPLYFDNNGGLVSGVIEVIGSNSKLRVIILDNTSANVQLDANNDGIYESSAVVAI